MDNNRVKYLYFQVNLDDNVAKNLADEDGNITRENFVQLGTKLKLIDMAGKADHDTPEHTPTKHPHQHHHHHHNKRVKK